MSTTTPLNNAGKQQVINKISLYITEADGGPDSELAKRTSKYLG